MAPFKPPPNPFAPQHPTSLPNIRRKVNEAGYADQLERERRASETQLLLLAILLAVFVAPGRTSAAITPLARITLMSAGEGGFALALPEPASFGSDRSRDGF